MLCTTWIFSEDDLRYKHPSDTPLLQPQSHLTKGKIFCSCCNLKVHLPKRSKHKIITESLLYQHSDNEFSISVLHVSSIILINFNFQVRPSVEEVFKNCRWNGQPRNCRLLFRHQLTEEGFCLSFNSKSAERSRLEYEFTKFILQKILSYKTQKISIFVY